MERGNPERTGFTGFSGLRDSGVGRFCGYCIAVRMERLHRREQRKKNLKDLRIREVGEANGLGRGASEAAAV
jgi:hypothetical protein